MTLGVAVISGLSTAVNSTVLCLFIYSFEKFKGEAESLLSLKLTLSVLFCLCFYIASALAWLTLGVFGMFHDDMNVDLCHAYWELGPSFYLMGRTCNALFFVLRLYHAFKGSAMQYSKRFTRRMAVAVVILGALQWAFFQLAMFGSSQLRNLNAKYRDDYQIDNFEDCNELRSAEIASAAQWFNRFAITFFLISDFILSIFLLRLFVRNLLLLPVQFEKTSMSRQQIVSEKMRAISSTKRFSPSLTGISVRKSADKPSTDKLSTDKPSTEQSSVQISLELVSIGTDANLLSPRSSMLDSAEGSADLSSADVSSSVAKAPKLTPLKLSKSPSKSRSNRAEMNSKRDEQFDATIRRSTTLVVISVLSTWFFLFVGTPLTAVVGFRDMSMPLDAMVNAICLYFQFSFAKPVYDVTCFGCNELCFHFCINTRLCRCFLLDCCECRYLIIKDSETSKSSSARASVRSASD